MLDDVLILGGSGFVGSRLCEMLLVPDGAAPGRVSVVTRRRDHVRHLLPLPGFHLEEGDVHDHATLARLAGAEAQFQPVWVDDVARAIVVCLRRSRDVLEVYECAGPRVYTLAELVRLAGRFSGHERPVVALPRPAGQLLAGLMECLPGEPLMSRDNLASMQVPNVASGQRPGVAALGITPAALEAIAPGYLSPR